MPVTINGKTYKSHDEAVRGISGTGIKDKDAYVATVERKQKVAELKSRIANIIKNVTDEDDTRKIKQIKNKKEDYNVPSSSK
jgi:hypothetical protein